LGKDNKDNNRVLQISADVFIGIMPLLFGQACLGITRDAQRLRKGDWMDDCWDHSWIYASPADAAIALFWWSKEDPRFERFPPDFIKVYS
jgi:hypothetical protein